MGQIEEKFAKLGKYKITLIQRDDGWKHWRLGLDRERDGYEWICENATVEGCLDMTIKYLKDEKHLEPQKKPRLQDMFNPEALEERNPDEYKQGGDELGKMLTEKQPEAPVKMQEFYDKLKDTKIKPLKFIENGMTDYVYYEKINEIVKYLNERD